MNLVKCQNGHFFDKNRFESCPHCIPGSNQNDFITMPVLNTGGDVITVPLTESAASSSEVTEAHDSPSLGDAVKSAIGGAPDHAAAVGDGDGKTVGFYARSMGTEPVVGWLVCITKGHFGEDFRLISGRNFIGRSADMDVVISKDNTVSRDKHAIVVYEPKGRNFLVMPGESKELCYLGGEVVLTPKELKPGDKLTVGETDLMFIPCCNDTFTWDDVKKEEK